MSIRKLTQTIFGADLEANFGDKQVQKVVLCLIFAEGKVVLLVGNKKLVARKLFS